MIGHKALTEKKIEEPMILNMTHHYKKVSSCCLGAVKDVCNIFSITIWLYKSYINLFVDVKQHPGERTLVYSAKFNVETLGTTLHFYRHLERKNKAG